MQLTQSRLLNLFAQELRRSALTDFFSNMRALHSSFCTKICFAAASLSTVWSRLGGFEQHLCMAACGLAFAAEHPGQFFDSARFIQKRNFRNGAALLLSLRYDKVGIGAGGDGGQVGDANHLMPASDLRHS